MDHASNWQKSTFSGGGEGDTCVELAAISPHLLGLRESDTPDTRLRTTPTPMAHLLQSIASGKLTSPRDCPPYRREQDSEQGSLGGPGAVGLRG